MQPDILTYNQVFQSDKLDLFSSLTNIEFLNSENNYLLFSGEETVHVKCKIDKKEYILVCFTNQNKNAENRYKSLAKIIGNYNLSFIPKLEFKENEIIINSYNSSVVLVEDDQTISLDNYFDNISFLPELVTKLQEDLKDLSSQLKAKQFAHGNLTFKTIRVNTKNELVLTFLDDLYIPEFETTKINKDSFVNLHNKDLASFAMILSALEIAKTDNSIQSNNLIFTFNSQDLNQIENSVAYSLIKSYENQAANNYLDYDALVEPEKIENFVTNDHNAEDYPLQNLSQNSIVDSRSDEKVQKIVITSSPQGVTVRDNEYEVFGNTPYIIEVKERDHPFQLILTEKSNIKKVDIFYGMNDVFVDFNETVAPTQNSISPEVKKQTLVTVTESKNTTQRVFFWSYIGILFFSMIIVILYNSAVFSDFYARDKYEEESMSIDSASAVVDSAVINVDSTAASPYYYDDTAVDSSAYYYDGY